MGAKSIESPKYINNHCSQPAENSAKQLKTGRRKKIICREILAAVRPPIYGKTGRETFSKNMFFS
jgi:hypothetical protein